MTQGRSKSFPSSYGHREIKTITFLITCVAIQQDGPRTSCLLSPLPCAWAGWRGSAATAFRTCGCYYLCDQQISAHFREKRCQKKFHEPLSFVAKHQALSDLAGGGRATRVYCSAHVPQVQSAGEASGHLGKTRAGSQLPPAAPVSCSLANSPVTAKRKKGSKSQGNCSAGCLWPRVLEWCPSAGQNRSLLWSNI